MENNQYKYTYSTSGSKNWVSVSPYTGPKAGSAEQNPNGIRFYPSQVPKAPQYNTWGCKCGKKNEQG